MVSRSLLFAGLLATVTAIALIGFGLIAGSGH